jgi:hypothetical protein
MVAEIVRNTIGIDTHNHIDVPLAAADRPGPALDLAGEMTRSGLSAICVTFAVDYQRITDPGQGYDRFINGPHVDGRATGWQWHDAIVESKRCPRRSYGRQAHRHPVGRGRALS